MSVTYTLDCAQRTLFITATGDLNRSMLEDAFDQVCTDPAFAPTFDTVVDFSAVIQLNLDMMDIQKLVARIQKNTEPQGRFAIITGTDQGRYSLGVYFKALAEGVSETQLRIFRTADEANLWLGLS